MLIYMLRNTSDLIRNTKIGKGYVGKTTATLPKRLKRHWEKANGKDPHFLIHKVMRQFGQTAFKSEVLAYATCKEELAALERFFILKYRTCLPEYGYNQDTGGGGPTVDSFTHASRVKLAVARKTAWARDPKAGAEQLAKARASRKPGHMGGAQPGELNHLYGTQHSSETRSKISAKAKAHYANGGKNPMQGVPSPMTGKKHSPEVIARMREQRRQWWADRANRAKMLHAITEGQNKPETKARQSVAAKQRWVARKQRAGVL